MTPCSIHILTYAEQYDFSQTVTAYTGSAYLNVELICLSFTIVCKLSLHTVQPLNLIYFSLTPSHPVIVDIRLGVVQWHDPVITVSGGYTADHSTQHRSTLVGSGIM